MCRVGLPPAVLDSLLEVEFQNFENRASIQVSFAFAFRLRRRAIQVQLALGTVAVATQ